MGSADGGSGGGLKGGGGSGTGGKTGAEGRRRFWHRRQYWRWRRWNGIQERVESWISRSEKVQGVGREKDGGGYANQRDQINQEQREHRSENDSQADCGNAPSDARGFAR